MTAICQRCPSYQRRPHADDRSPSAREVSRESPFTGAAWRRVPCLRLHSPNVIRQRCPSYQRRPHADDRSPSAREVNRDSQSRAPHGVGYHAYDRTPRTQYANVVRHTNAARMPTTALRAHARLTVTRSHGRRMASGTTPTTALPPQYANVVRHTNAARMPTTALRARARLTVTRSHGRRMAAVLCLRLHSPPQYANVVRHTNAARMPTTFFSRTIQTRV